MEDVDYAKQSAAKNMEDVFVVLRSKYGITKDAEGALIAAGGQCFCDGGLYAMQRLDNKPGTSIVSQGEKK